MDMAAKARGRIIERGKAVARRRVEQPRQHGPAFAVERDHRVGGIVASGRRHDFQLCRHAAIMASRRSPRAPFPAFRSEEHTSELQSLMRISYAVFCLQKKNT